MAKCLLKQTIAGANGQFMIIKNTPEETYKTASGLVVERPASVEMSAWGVASLAGLEVSCRALPPYEFQV